MALNLIDIARQFRIECGVVDVRSIGEGFINNTYRVLTPEGAPEYILQRKNKSIFPDVPGMMDNILKVTAHIKSKVADPLRGTLTVVPALDGKPYWEDSDGEFWAVTLLIPDTVSYDVADSPALARKGGEGIGRFQRQLADFTTPLVETIKGFHNIRWRFVQWDECLARDAAGRKASLATEIGWIESRREQMLDYWKKVESGEIPMRVTHNDTKISNFLFDREGNVETVIDLDTVMTAPALNDFGDAIRSYTNTGAEDEKDLSRVSISMEMFKAYTEGYLSEMAGSLCQAEKDHLAFSALYITYEQVLRFLMDYIDGDTYYRTKYEGHNLVRTHAQYKLLQDMEAHLEEMNGIVRQALER